MDVNELFKTIQEACLPAIWSQGVTLTRSGAVFVQDSATPEEIVLRVVSSTRPVSPRVTLALKDLDWYCDCGDRNDPCAHVAGAVIAAKKGELKVRVAPQGTNGASTDRSSGAGNAGSGASVGGERRPFGDRMSQTSADANLARYVSYRFKRTPAGLSFERVLVSGADEAPITGSLLSTVSGTQSGRIPGAKLSATKADFLADSILKQGRGPATGVLARDTLVNLLSCLEDSPNVTLDGQPVRTSRQPVGLRTRLVDDGEGFRLQRYQATEGCESLGNGVLLERDIIKPLQATKLSPEESRLLEGEGQYVARKDAGRFVTDVLPELQKKTPVEIQTTRLPRVIEVPPRMLLQLERDRDAPEALNVLAKLVYGDPPVAQVHTDTLALVHLDRPTGDKIPDIVRRDPVAERQLMHKLKSELNFQAGRRVQYHGQDAVRWVKNLKGWETTGNGYAAFLPNRTLTPHLKATDRGFTVEVSASPRHSEGQPDSKPHPSAEADAAITHESLALGSRVDPARMFRAWREGAEFVPLLDGGWAPLPLDWLKMYGKRIEDMLAAKNAQGDLPAHTLPQLAALCDDMGVTAPLSLSRLKESFENFDRIPESKLPEGLRADLRLYQRKGVNWLSFMRDSKLGALLADDMGLGKTLQALCSVQGRTLVVAPTSVLYNWQTEVEKFRPNLRTCVYYGPGRRIDANADVLLTTYTLLRLDLETLANEHWGTIVLDEAQTIKNPDSQVARAAHKLHGDFRIALSGTPIENRLDDLWSQFQFLNPGLLGTREEFREDFIAPIGKGDANAAARLRNKTKPFILRRLKRSVAPELPPRTETVLRCELSESERNLYDSLLIASRKEVLAELEAGGSIMAALEVLLRLRQACCHPALVPGQQAEHSSKLDLLLETLEESLEQGHRSLIFSQWTSYLDLIQRELEAKGIRFSRIDGSTQNRQDLVNEFQNEGGPSVMLISLKAGGTGLTLTAADHIFIMDPWWNPAVEDQAADRAHRIGQKNPVLIHRLVAQDSVEERVLLLQKKKTELAGAVLDGTGAALTLTRDDLMSLLQ